MVATSYIVDNDRKFREALARAKAEVSNLTLPLTLIAKDFQRSEKAIFLLKSEGQYPDLSENYKPEKKKAVGFLYPILKRTGALERSLTTPTDPDTILEIVNQDTLFIGTRVKYAIYHQSDEPRKKIPLRKFLFIGPEAPRFATSDMMGRPERWLNILNAFVLRKMGAPVESEK